MPGAVPLDDLPDNLRGTAVPDDDLPSGPPPANTPRKVKSLGDIVPGEKEGVDYVFDKPARAPTDNQPTAGRLALGLADNALHAATSIPAEIAVSATRLFGGGAHAQDAVRNTIQYPLLTQSGRDIAAEGDAAASRLVTPVASKVKSGLDATGIPNLSNDLGSILQTGGDLANVFGFGAPLAMAGREAAAASNASKLFRATDPANVTRDVGNTLGLGARPSDFEAAGGKPGIFRLAAEKVGGSQTMKRDYILNNLKRTEEAVGADIGLPAGRAITPDALENAKAPHAAVYDTARTLPEGPLSAEFHAGVRSIDSSDSLLPPSPQVQALQQQFAGQGSMNGSQLVDTISNLRREGQRNAISAKKGMQADNFNPQRLSDAQFALADLLDAELERMATGTDPALGANIQNARRGFAQIGTAERALDGRWIDPQNLVKQVDKNPAISGRTRAVADFARDYPRTMTATVPDITENPLRLLTAIPELGSAGVRKLFGRAPTPGDTGPSGPLGRYFRPPAAPEPGGPMPPNGGPPRPDFYGPQGLSLEPDFQPQMPQGAGVLPWENPVGPGESLRVAPTDARFADSLTYDGQPTTPPTNLYEWDAVPPSAEGLGTPDAGPTSFADQLGTPARGAGELQPNGAPLEIQPEGLSQVSSPELPPGLDPNPQQRSFADYLPADNLGQIQRELQPRGVQAPGESDWLNMLDGSDLSLVPDSRPGSPRVDVTEGMQSQGTTKFPDRYKRPEAKRVETGNGYISYVEKGDSWQIDDAFVKEGSRGKGAGQSQLVKLAQDAAENGKTLNSDVKVSADQRRVYEKLKAAGKIDYEDGPEGGPIFVNIRPVGE